MSRRSSVRRSDRFPTQVRQIVAARSGGVCEWCLSEPADHMHHRRLRQRTGPGDTHGASNALHVCASCHDDIHHAPTNAAKLGGLIPTGGNPTTVPLLRWDMRTLIHTAVMLTDDGSIRPSQTAASGGVS